MRRVRVVGIEWDTKKSMNEPPSFLKDDGILGDYSITEALRSYFKTMDIDTDFTVSGEPSFEVKEER